MLFINNKSLQVILIIVIATVFRLPGLSERPMHGDEAVNAVKFSQLMESGQAVYDSAEYHGPSLYYFTLPAAWASGNLTFKELTETILRVVPVIFGMGLILLLFIPGFQGEWYILCIAALLTAISPAFVYYSRYYIHEMVLVFFCYLAIISGYLYSRDKKFLWLSLLALSLGLMISTKETWIIIVPLMVISLCLTFLPFKKQRNVLLSFISSVPLKHVVGFLSILLLTPILFYTSFFHNPDGMVRSLSVLSGYVQHAGNNENHIHEWYMYFKWLLYFKGNDGIVWSEGIIALFAFAGLFGIISKYRLRSKEHIFFYFMLIFSASTALAFSVIPYKTPWNLLTFWFGFIILASFGIYYIFQILDKKIYKVIFFILTLILVIHLGWQSFQLNFKRSFSVGNPYVYAHPVKDVFKITRILENIANRHPEGHQIHIQIIAANSDYWPLPWYLRNFDRVGWWDKVDLESAAAPIIIAQADLENQLIQKLYEIPPPGRRYLYTPLFQEYTELRPGVEMRGYLRQDLSDLLNRDKEQTVEFENE